MHFHEPTVTNTDGSLIDVLGNAYAWSGPNSLLLWLQVPPKPHPLMQSNVNDIQNLQVM